MSRLFRDVDRAMQASPGCVACVGAFDGLHLGHQALVRRAVDDALAREVRAVAITFDPLPREFFSRGAVSPRLMSTRTRIERLFALGIDDVLLLRFDARLSGMEAADFVSRVLVDALRVESLWVGPDFRFGRARAGDIDLLRNAGARHGFQADAIDPVAASGERISSTRIRDALAAGDFQLAARLLGRPYRIEGRVVRGRQLGRTLRYPTANLRLPAGTPPLTGIFATRVHGLSPTPLDAVSSLGTRPTVGGIEPLLETHIFDFDADIYARRIGIEFVEKLRDEVKFDGLPALVAQMDRDADQARQVLAPLNSRRTA
ncbi:bifunctional riboflavin kinase/FAD synthetase [Cognatilysobacter lacus]|uniref:Riboflavin biosynthesis protein n=1 Tax=Cognatilysobacter lacus TaxID=1643323 RepID=A0A5D8Z821_9GAMM|nr:bifunctional riboflavin kinase/FAD synthetase [Lysobacter lacus]TZF90941.1 bifunctional riboflavin kinase/FAD synthetase [Lysobacter lacus]